MKYNIINYNSNIHLQRLANLINENPKNIFPYYEFSENQISDVIENNSWWDCHYEQNNSYDKNILCVENRDNIIVSALEYVLRDSEGLTFYIDWLFVRKGHENSLDLLIKHIIDKCNKLHIDKIEVCPRHSFGLGWSGIFEKESEVHKILEANGFASRSEWTVFQYDLHNDIENDNNKYELKIVDNIENQETDITLFIDNEAVGECSLWNIPSYFKSSDINNKSWITIEWIEIYEQYRKKGFGKLFMTIILNMLHTKSFKNVVLWAESYVEQFYVKYGFEKVDKSVGYTLNFQNKNNIKTGENEK